MPSDHAAAVAVLFTVRALDQPTPAQRWLLSLTPILRRQGLLPCRPNPKRCNHVD